MKDCDDHGVQDGDADSGDIHGTMVAMAVMMPVVVVGAAAAPHRCRHRCSNALGVKALGKSCQRNGNEIKEHVKAILTRLQTSIPTLCDPVARTDDMRARCAHRPASCLRWQT